MDKYTRLLKDSIIYFMGNMGSKIVSLLLVSFYTFTLSTEEYGSIDVTQTTIALIVPLTTLCIHEAVLRYTLKSRYDKDSVITNGILLLAVSVLIAVPATVLMSVLQVITGNIFIIVAIIACESLNTLLGQYCRGINKTKIYALAGVICTFVLAVSNIILLKVFHFGVDGYLLSIVFGYLASALILAFGSKVFKTVSLKKADIGLLKTMLKFSLPLIPNSIMWWVMNAADKYSILYICGNSANGLYAVAAKVPTIITTVTSIFMQAWQVSAIVESNSKEKSQFYSNVFNGLYVSLFMAVSLILLVLKPVIKIAIESSYYECWEIIPFLLLSAIFSSFSSFLGVNYTAMEKTGGASKTVCIGAVCNICLNIVLLKIIGLSGAALATALSFLVIWLLRIRDTKQFVQIDFQWKRFGATLLVVLAQIFLMFVLNDVMTLLAGIVCCVFIALINFPTIKILLRNLIRRGKKNANIT